MDRKGTFVQAREWLSGQYDHEARELLFGHHPTVGAVLTANPVLVFIGASAIGFLLLLAAWATGVIQLVHEMPEGGATGDVGYLASVNWSVMYCLVLPFIFAEAARVTVKFAGVIKRLSNNKTGLIKCSDSSPEQDGFYDYFKCEVNRTPGLLYRTSLIVLTVIIVGLDSARWVSALLFGGQTADYNALVDRWSTAARSAEWSVGVVPNVVFDVLAYTVEAVVIFFAFFYVLRLWKALLILGKAITTDRRFTFDPWIQDRENKLGLGSLGSVFTGFLLIVVLFLFYVAFHAIQLDAWHRGYLEFDYVRKVASDYWALALSFRGQYPDWNLLFGDTRITGYTDPGMRILLATIVIPITAVVYVPLFMIKNYLGTLIDNERNVGRAKLRELQSQGVLDDDPRVKAIDARWNKLQAAQVWPCGNAVALRYFSYMSLLVLSAFLPRLGILVCTGIVVAVFARKVVPWLPAKEKK